MSARTFYVVHFRRWVPAGRFPGGRWATSTNVTLERPTASEYTALIGIYAVRCATKAEAVPVVMEWLATGRPSAMEVRELP